MHGRRKWLSNRKERKVSLNEQEQSLYKIIHGMSLADIRNELELHQLPTTVTKTSCCQRLYKYKRQDLGKGLSTGPFTLRSIYALRKCSYSFRSILDRSQFAFERSHSDRFGSNSLVWMAPKTVVKTPQKEKGIPWETRPSNPTMR